MPKNKNASYIYFNAVIIENGKCVMALQYLEISINNYFRHLSNLVHKVG